MNGEQFNRALASHKKGEHLVYHVGNLQTDRLFYIDVDSRANAAWRAYQEGKCLLFQRRVGTGQCQYIAVKIGKKTNDD